MQTIIPGYAQPVKRPGTKAYRLSKEQAIAMLPLPPAKKHQVLVLGSPHFDLGSNASDWKPEKELDMRTPEKQLEIEQVVDALKKFRPTKICIEWPPNLDSVFAKRYQSYLSGKEAPGIGEYYQVGFRLAKAMGHKKVYCIDNKPSQPESLLAVEDWDQYLAQQGSLSESEKKMYDSLNQRFNHYLDSVQFYMTLSDYLLFVNSDEVKRQVKRLWLTGLVHAGNNTTYVGADLTGNWYQRNVRIFSNVKKRCTEPEERILIIYGHNHAFVLDEIFRGSQEFEVVRVSDVLK